LYYIYVLEFSYDKKILENYLIERHYDDTHRSLFQISEAEYYLKICGFMPYWYELGDIKLKKILLGEPSFSDFDKNDDAKDKSNLS